MADTLKILGQSAPAATVLTDMYTVPLATSAIISCLTVCNPNTTTCAIRVSIAKAGAVNSQMQYLYFDLPIEPNDTLIEKDLKISLAAGDIVRVQACTLGVSFNITGLEIT